MLIWAFVLAAIATFIYGVNSGGRNVVVGMILLIALTVSLTVIKTNSALSEWRFNPLDQLRYVIDAISGNWITAEYLLVPRNFRFPQLPVLG